MTSETEMQAASWYDAGRHLSSPSIERALDVAGRLHAQLEEFLRGHPALELRRVGPFLLWNGQRLCPDRSNREALEALADALSGWEIESLRFTTGLTRDEVFATLQLLGTLPESTQIWPGAAARLRDAGVQHVSVQTAPAVTLAPPSAVLLRVHRQQAVRLYRRAVEVHRRLQTSACRGAALQLRGARRILQLCIDLLEEDEAPLLGLTVVKSSRFGSEVVATHAVNVSILSMILGRAAGLGRRELEVVGRAALLHDLGDAGGCDLAPLDGARSIKVAGTLFATAPSEAESLLVALELHRPAVDRVSADAPEVWRASLAARIVAIADAYDRLTSRRVHGRPQVSPDRALACLQGEGGTRFDAALVALFVRQLGGFPPGTAVQLDTGDVGVVLRTHRAAFDRPVVRLLLDAEGCPYPGEPNFDLAAQDAGPRRTIVRSLDPETLGLDPARLFLPSAS